MASEKDWEQERREMLSKSNAWIWDDVYMRSITDTEQVSLISRALDLFGNHLLDLAEQWFEGTCKTLLSDNHHLAEEISRLRAELCEAQENFNFNRKRVETLEKQIDNMSKDSTSLKADLKETEVSYG